MPSIRRLSISTTSASTILAGCLALCAFALRAYHLGSQSLWYDEGISLYYSSADPSTLVGILARLGEFPPLYFVSLHYWTAVAGQGELALRFPSALAGVLGVALTYQLGRRLAGPGVGLAAGLLLAVSPLHVWQSQETRMYTLAVALSLLSTYLFVRLPSAPHRGFLAAYALAGAAGLYTHFTFALVLLAQMVCLAAWVAAAGFGPASRTFLADRLRAAMPAALGAVASGALFLPWVPLVFQTYRTNATYWPGRLDVVAAARDTLAAFVAGELAQPLDRSMLALGAGALACLGLLVAAAGSSTRPDSVGGASERVGIPSALLLACYLLVPAAAEALLLLDRPKYAPRYLLVVLPAFCVLAAWAMSALPRAVWGWAEGRAARHRARPRPGASGPKSNGRDAGPEAPSAATLVPLVPGFLLGIALVAASVWSARAQATDPTLAREDFRGLAAYLAAQATGDDAIILLGGHIQVPFYHYYRDGSHPGAAPVYPLPDSLLPAVARPIQHDDLAALNAIVPGRRRVWVVRWQDRLADPAGMVVQQLEWAGRRVDPGRAFPGLQLDAFEVPGNPTFPVAFQPRQSVGASFANGLELLGYDLTSDRAKPGDTLGLTLYWRAVAPAGADYVAFAQLLNPADHIYGQHDKPPVSELYRTSRWAAGDLLKDDYRVRVLPGTPPGQYRLQVGLYDRASLQRVQVRATPGSPLEDHLVLAEVSVALGEPLGPNADALRHSASLDVAPGMRLVGWQTEPEPLQAGAPNRVALLWHATATVPAGWQIRLALLARDGREVAATAGPPADGTYPTERWRPGDLVRDIHNLAPPAGLPEGEYALAVAAVAPNGQASQAVSLGAVKVR